MSKKVYETTIPNYIIDIWLPIIGAKALGVYIVYVRLEREGTVKAHSQTDIAKATRIGTRSLKDINNTLVDCGFIDIRQPQGYEITMHYTTEITIKDPPKEIPKEIIEKYQPPSGLPLRLNDE